MFDHPLDISYAEVVFDSKPRTKGDFRAISDTFSGTYSCVVLDFQLLALSSSRNDAREPG